MKKLLIVLFIASALFGCIKDGNKSEIPKFSTLAQRDAIILNELKKQTAILNEINQKLTNQPLQASR